MYRFVKSNKVFARYKTVNIWATRNFTKFSFVETLREYITEKLSIRLVRSSSVLIICANY